MGRSSRLVPICFALALSPTTAPAQLYGFPGEVGVLDDGFGTLPPQVAPPFDLPVAPPVPSDTPVAVRAQRPPCALIIQVGRGLRHRATTRVVYGRAAPCR